MESTEIEKLQLEIIGSLCTLPIECLKELCDFLLIAGDQLEHVERKNRTSLILMISNHLQSEELQQLEDMGMTTLLTLKDKITELQIETMAVHANEPQTSFNKDLDEHSDTHSNAAEESKLFQSQQQNNTQVAGGGSEHKAQSTPPIQRMTASGSSLAPTPSLWHKEFKISGQIGEPGQKDRLPFSSLARQIEHGLVKGFPETEIVDAVIRAIVPGMQLRSYLEGKGDLTLPTLRRILRCHYQEKSATELYKRLSSEVQSIKETPQSFLIRALDLRQKILFASQESESGLRYDPVLVQNMFLHTVMTGLQSDNIKRDIQPFLEKEDVSDELLFEKLNIACAYESERQDKKKLTVPQRHATVHSAQSDHTPNEKKEKTSQASNKTDILSELQEMKANMILLKDLKAEVSSIKESMRQPSYQHQQHPSILPGPECTSQHMAADYNNPTSTHRATPAPTAQQGYLQPTDMQHRYRPASAAQQWYPRAPGAEYGFPQAPAVHGYLPPNQRYDNQRSFPTPPPRLKRRCYSCQQENLENCTHCFKCGSSEHFSAGCRMGRSGQVRRGALNEQGPPQRGRE